MQLAHTAASGAWTLLCIDLAAALAARSHGYRCMKSLQLCATLSVRGAFTSDIVYSLKVSWHVLGAGCHKIVLTASASWSVLIALWLLKQPSP